jgi:alkylation response protein AidB-like acyl-CoA dehydrogenase
LLTYAKNAPDNETVLKRSSTWRLDYVDRWVEADIARLFSHLNNSIQDRGMVPNHEASMSKLFTTELGQNIARTNIKLFGLYGNLWDRSRTEAMKSRAAGGFLSAVSSTIAGGTSEIQRNIIATRGLGLPRG